MKTNFEAVMEQVFKHEGGYVNHPKDPGGETNFGISKRAHPGVNIRALTKAQAREIYRKSYWNPVRGDDLAAGVDLAVMDYAVNSGVSRSAKALQAVVKVSQDGKIGPQTLKAAAAGNPVEIVKAVCARRMSFLRGLKTWKTFSKGWSRRVAEVEALGVKMAAQSVVAKPSSVNEVLKAEQKAAQAAAAGAKKNAAAAGVGTATAAGVGSATVAGVEATAQIQTDPTLMGLVAAVLGLVAAFAARRSAHNNQRAAAFARLTENQ
ncbi:glycoside hydrolase family 108 protein [Paracoccus sanguinis]|uniref:glycoside hydrolase family 108 protein n=1 Tax=Paracoccus sanguinis TaxID=1545044 RepID=UPI00068AAC8C|nr:glycosyl hydrolase 108 family protein [Paracoccus sanguinis]